jgi:hypothetical protein
VNTTTHAYSSCLAFLLTQKANLWQGREEEAKHHLGALELTHYLRGFLHKLDGRQYVLFARLHDATIHHHLFEHEVDFLQMEHDVKLTLARTDVALAIIIM